MSGRFLILVIALAFCVSPASLCAHPSLVTGNQFVWAEVDDSTGWISFTQGPVTDRTLGAASHTLSHKEGSFLWVMVNGTEYTNDCEWGPGVPGLLSNGKTSQIKDTLQTIWHQSGFDIIQDVYPVAFVKSGQIVVKVSVINLTGKPLAVQAQYLLDDEIDGIVQSKYGARSITKYGRGTEGSISSVDVSYPPFGLDSVAPPTFFMAFSQVAPQTEYLSNVVGVGYLSDEITPRPLGLVTPSLFAIGDVNRIAGRCSWGTSIYAGESYLDEAMFIVWPPDTLAASGNNASAIIGCTSYGTGEYEVCEGSATAITFFPHEVQWSNGKIIPNRCTVESLIVRDASQSSVATLTVAGSQRIVAPKPISSGGLSQTQTLAASGWSKVLDLQWTDSVFALSDTTVSMTLTFSGGPSPAFTNACSLPITIVGIPNPSKSLISTISRSGGFDGSLCNARRIQAEAIDIRSCKICEVVSVGALALQNMRFSIDDSSTWKFSLWVIDSMQNGSASVVAHDGTGEMDTTYYTYCTIADKQPPYFEHTACIDTCQSCLCFRVHDDSPWDRGLDTVYVTSIERMMIDEPLRSVMGESVSPFTATINDTGKGATICLTAIDRARHRADTCFIFRPLLMVGDYSNRCEMSLHVYPNPATDVATIQTTGTTNAAIEVSDVLGRRCATFGVDGTYQWDTSALPRGTYILRATSGDNVRSKRLMKE